MNLRTPTAAGSDNDEGKGRNYSDLESEGEEQVDGERESDCNEEEEADEAAAQKENGKYDDDADHESMPTTWTGPRRIAVAAGF